MKLPQNPENENGFAKLKPSAATEAPAHLGESRARDERSRHAQLAQGTIFKNLNQNTLGLLLFQKWIKIL